MKNLIKLIFVICGLLSAQTVTTLVSGISSRNLEAIAVSNDGLIYTISPQIGTAYRVTLKGEVELIASGLQFPEGGAVDQEGNYYVSNWNTGVITKVDLQNNKSTYATGFAGPTGLAFTNDYNYLYVCNYSNNRVSRINTSTKDVETVAAGNGISGPDGIDFDDDGNCYVANFNNNKILKILPDGTVNLFVELPSENSGYITFAKGNLYVAGHTANVIYKVDLKGQVEVFAGSGEVGLDDGPALEATFHIPNGITSTANGDSLIIADARNKAIRIIDISNTTDIQSGAKVNNFFLGQNYPNPFNPSTNIPFTINESGNVSLEIYSITGERVATVIDQYINPGNYEYKFSAENLSAGHYFYKIRHKNKVEIKKLTLLK